MSPFWAVRRLTDKQLAREVTLTEAGKKPPRFNCTLVTQNMSCVTVGVAKARRCSTTRIFEVPFLTNNCEVAEGAELIMRVDEKKVPEQKPRKWKQAFQDDQKAADKLAKVAKKT